MLHAAREKPVWRLLFHRKGFWQITSRHVQFNYFITFFLFSCASFVVLELSIHFLSNSVIKITFKQQWQVKYISSESAVWGIQGILGQKWKLILMLGFLISV